MERGLWGRAAGCGGGVGGVVQQGVWGGAVRQGPCGDAVQQGLCVEVVQQGVCGGPCGRVCMWGVMQQGVPRGPVGPSEATMGVDVLGKDRKKSDEC